MTKGTLQPKGSEAISAEGRELLELRPRHFRRVVVKLYRDTVEHIKACMVLARNTPHFDIALVVADHLHGIFNPFDEGFRKDRLVRIAF